jgi:hypothetical protein
VAWQHAAMLTWNEVAERLAPWRNYWISTVDVAGGPHASPVWGAVVDEVLYFYTEDGTVKARNLERDPRVAVHLEVIVRGTAEPGRRRGVAAFAAKYTRPDDLQYVPTVTDTLNQLFAVRPTNALVWLLEDYEGSQRRWTAAPKGPR